ncbi:NAD-dependent epimerase/dehydratase family protein [Paraburkholderia youngii]|uniref:NAD-dependent epimerase/dehydratase family protein n=1 Tax=Paraburkholderia youngii TaxID=2782701 RepID=UPI003D20F969
MVSFGDYSTSQAIVGENALKLFITGGTGYIGQAIARRAISRGHQVTAMVRQDAPRLI